MAGLSTTLFDLISADPTVDAYVGRTTLQGSAVTVSGVFQGEAPRGAVLPFIVISGSVADQRLPILDGHGREITRDVKIYQRASEDLNDLEDIAEHLFGLIWSATVSVTGYHVATIEPLSGPVVAPTDETIAGRVIPVRAVLYKAEA